MGFGQIGRGEVGNYEFSWMGEVVSGSVGFGLVCPGGVG